MGAACLEDTQAAPAPADSNAFYRDEPRDRGRVPTIFRPEAENRPPTPWRQRAIGLLGIAKLLSAIGEINGEARCTQCEGYVLADV